MIIKCSWMIENYFNVNVEINRLFFLSNLLKFNFFVNL